MYNFVKRNQDNIGGNETFWFVPASQVTSIPDQENGVITEDIVLAGTYQFLQGYATHGTLSVEDDPKDNENGISVPVSIKGRAPKDIPELTYLFTQMMRERFIVLVRSANGDIKVYGKVGFGLNFRFKTLKPAEASGYNGYEFEFFRTYGEPAWFYSGVFEVDDTFITSTYEAGVVYSVGGRWHFGTGVPASTLGKSGDGYFDTVTNLVYEKQGDTWVEIGYLGPDQELEEYAYCMTSLAITGNLI